MYILLLLSVAVIAIVIEKYRVLGKVKHSHSALVSMLRDQSSIEKISAVVNDESYASPAQAMLKKLVDTNEEDLSLTTQLMESTANMELHKLESGMGWLSTFAAVAPLIGFLGTVIGMVRVFFNIETQSQSGVDIALLAGGIWEAMLTTIGGLIVGIIAIVFYNDLVQRFEQIAKDLNDQALEYIIKIRSLQSGANQK